MLVRMPCEIPNGSEIKLPVTNPFQVTDAVRARIGHRGFGSSEGSVRRNLSEATQALWAMTHVRTADAKQRSEARLWRVAPGSPEILVGMR
jgi:hypothetical protein